MCLISFADSPVASLQLWALDLIRVSHAGVSPIVVLIQLRQVLREAFCRENAVGFLWVLQSEKSPSFSVLWGLQYSKRDREKVHTRRTNGYEMFSAFEKRHVLNVAAVSVCFLPKVLNRVGPSKVVGWLPTTQ